MTFIHPLLLGGLLLVGIPVLLHLIMRQKPKILPFPAFRFLVQRARANQRQLQLRHLLLLALRMLLIALLCLALARPKLFNERLNLASGQPVAIALVFDTSASMEYADSTNKNRLETAKERARELLDDLPEGSRVAVFDSAEPVSGEWLPSLGLVKERIDALQIRYANGPVTDVLAPAYRLLATLDEEEHAGEPMPRFLHAFSDRADSCWDAKSLPQLKELRDRMTAPPVHAVFVDVGVEQPTNLAIAEVELPRQIVPAHDRVVLKVKTQATGRDYDTEILCRIDDKPAERRPIKPRAGQTEEVGPFEVRDLPPGLHRAEISLAAADHLPFSAVRFATFEVRGPRSVLTITDRPGNDPSGGDAYIWRLALERGGSFHCDVKSTQEAAKLSPKELARKYRAVCLLSVARPDSELWNQLLNYVENGGGLAIVPGGAELKKAFYDDQNENAAVNRLMPGRFVGIVDAPDGAAWKISKYTHPIMAPFREWEMAGSVDFIKLPPKAWRYWEVEPRRDEDVIVSYGGEKPRPALLERGFADRKQTRGRVLLFTTPMDGRPLSEKSERMWNNYLETSFFFVLANQTVGYLAGDADAGTFNYLTGQTATVPLPPEPRFPMYQLQGPGLPGSALAIPRSAKQSELRINQATMPGQYTLLGGDGKWTAGFSMNVPPAECNLTKVPAEQIEALFGAGALLPLGPKASLKDALQNRWSQPVELFPWLMILLLLALAVENLLANRFYKRETGETKA